MQASGSCHGFAHHRSLVQDPVGPVLSTELPTDYDHDIKRFRDHECLWKVGEGLKWVALYSISVYNTCSLL